MTPSFKLKPGEPRTATGPRPQSGFSLIELMVTVGILAIVASIAVPAYTNYVKRSKLSEAFNQLSAWAMSEEQYFQDNRAYVCGATTGLAQTPSSPNFGYSCALAGNVYTLTATGSSTSTSGFSFTLDSLGTHKTIAAPSGWPTSTSCWINSTSGTCY